MCSDLFQECAQTGSRIPNTALFQDVSYFVSLHFVLWWFVKPTLLSYDFLAVHQINLFWRSKCSDSAGQLTSDHILDCPVLRLSFCWKARGSYDLFHSECDHTTMIDCISCLHHSQREYLNLELGVSYLVWQTILLRIIRLRPDFSKIIRVCKPLNNSFILISYPRRHFVCIVILPWKAFVIMDSSRDDDNLELSDIEATGEVTFHMFLVTIARRHHLWLCSQ